MVKPNLGLVPGSMMGAGYMAPGLAATAAGVGVDGRLYASPVQTVRVLRKTAKCSDLIWYSRFWFPACYSTNLADVGCDMCFLSSRSYFFCAFVSL